MKFEYLDLQHDQAVVQKKKKYATFRVTEIGGPAEITKWRETQAAKESAYRMRLNLRDARVATFEKESDQRLDSPKIRTATWKEKLAFIKEERRRLDEAKECREYDKWEILPPPRLGLWTRITLFMKRIFEAANF